MIAERTVLITGASSGIGRCFAEAYARQNCRLILCGRNTDALEELSRQLNTECTVIPGNLSEEDQCFQLLKQLEDNRIDIFINNAGFGAAGRFTEIPLEKELEMVRVNDLAQHILFKGILQKMQQQDSGTILNVASSAGLFPGGPYMAAYYASKAYMASLTRSVAQELKETGSNVYVCALCPGPVDTQFNNRADV
ncbi:MAG: SDR family NAD(P)-dependent oxidoreductase, partial [Erysipelotrichaceae bacterium]|nr:SDR family NAD(P)-dependent oxidoreductase [Erysipelotrichaceae bacterium]